MTYLPRNTVGTHRYGRRGSNARLKRAFLFCAALIGMAGAVWLAVEVKQRRGAKIDSRPREEAVALPSAEATEYVPPFRATTFDGTPFAVASYEGTSAIVLDFWASWCVPCATDMPRLKSVAASFGEDRVAVVGIHRGDTEAAEQGSALTTRLGIDYLLVQDPEGKLFALLSRGKPFMPLTLFIDHDGRVLDRRIGPKTEEEIRVSIAKIVN